MSSLFLAYSQPAGRGAVPTHAGRARHPHPGRHARLPLARRRHHRPRRDRHFLHGPPQPDSEGPRRVKVRSAREIPFPGGGSLSPKVEGGSFGTSPGFLSVRLFVVLLDVGFAMPLLLFCEHGRALRLNSPPRSHSVSFTPSKSQRTSLSASVPTVEQPGRGRG